MKQAAISKGSCRARYRSRHRRLAGLSLALSVLCVLQAAPPLSSRAHAQSASKPDAPQSPGRGIDALPGVHALALVSPFGDGASAAGSLGYGYTESVEDLSDTHHRVLLSGAASYALFDVVGFGLSFLGHYDQHDGGTGDGDSSFALATRFHGRVRHALRPDLSVGAELAVKIPAADGASQGLKSLSPELRGLATWTGAHPKLVLGAQLGMRLDRSGEALNNTGRLSGADRIALGASDSSAILLGAGGTFVVAPRHRVLGELTWDLLVGPDATKAGTWPMRVVLGYRYSLSDWLALDALLGISPSARPSVAMGRALVPIEPRVWLGVGVSAFLGALHATPRAKGVITGRILDEQGAALPNARITTQGALSTTVTAGTDGRFSIHADQGSRLTLSANVEHYLPGKRDAALQGERLDLGDWKLAHGRGSVRGRVLGPDGMPKASVIVGAYDSVAGPASGEEAITEAITSDAGTFLLEALPSGPVQLVASALGFRDAQVAVTVLVEQEQQVEIKLAEALPEGQIRGTVRGASGAQLAATIRVEPLGLVIAADRAGAFSLDVAPGSYQLLVTAPGYEPQQRDVEVERDGVTVVLVDLLRQP